MLSHLRLFPVSKRLAPSIRWFSNEVIREQGEVLWFNHKRGFGFIAYQNGKNIFVHQSQIASDGFRALLAGERVQFEVEDNGGSARPSAMKVTGPNGLLFKSSRLPKDPNQGKNDIGINVEKHDDSRVINISITIPESSRTKMIRVKQTRDKPKRDGNSPV